MGETWRELYPLTAFVRDALRRKVAESAPEALLEPEQTLLTACEFWASVNTGGLSNRVRQQMMVPLMRAQQAFAEIDAVRVASVLRVLVKALARDPDPATIKKLIARVEEDLAHTDDPVDQLIARFAADKLNLRGEGEGG
jgi:hypothetical protein